VSNGTRVRRRACQKSHAAETKAFVEKAQHGSAPAVGKQGNAEWIKSTYITTPRRQRSDGEQRKSSPTPRTPSKKRRAFSASSSTRTPSADSYICGYRPPSLPRRSAKREEVAKNSRQASKASTVRGKWCGADGKATRCATGKSSPRPWPRATSGRVLEAWTGWHTISRESARSYQRFVELATKEPSRLGFAKSGGPVRRARH